jgi:hypothetical protein
MMGLKQLWFHSRRRRLMNVLEQIRMFLEEADGILEFYGCHVI